MQKKRRHHLATFSATKIEKCRHSYSQCVINSLKKTPYENAPGLKNEKCRKSETHDFLGASEKMETTEEMEKIDGCHCGRAQLRRTADGKVFCFYAMRRQKCAYCGTVSAMPSGDSVSTRDGHSFGHHRGKAVASPRKKYVGIYPSNTKIISDDKGS
jgi:hypothetical protein